MLTKCQIFLSRNEWILTQSRGGRKEFQRVCAKSRPATGRGFAQAFSVRYRFAKHRGTGRGVHDHAP
jgi:hypothetical protein